MRADDVSTLFLPSPPGAAQQVMYRQGTVITFDPITLSNTIRVDGVDLVDLPLLGVTEAATLRAGDVIGLQLVGSTWAIAGQYVLPGSPQAARALSVTSANTYSKTVGDFETTDNSSWHDLTTTGPVVENVLIGPSGRCLVYITSTITILGTEGGGEMAYEISGATTVGTGDTPPALAYYGPVGSGPTATRLVLQEGLNPGLHEFVAQYSAVDFGPGGEARFGGRNLTVVAL